MKLIDIEVYVIVVFAIVLSLAVFLSDTVFGSIPNKPVKSGCDQRLYDAIYKVITREALIEGLKDLSAEQERLINMKRYSEIMSLRALCNGQISTYEKRGLK